MPALDFSQMQPCFYCNDIRCFIVHFITLWVSIEKNVDKRINWNCVGFFIEHKNTMRAPTNRFITVVITEPLRKMKL